MPSPPCSSPSASPSPSSPGWRPWNVTRHVSNADRALRSQSQIDALLAYLPEYEQLVAETGAARFSAPEIGHLSEDAAQLQRALRDSVRSAHEAFRYLDGPPRG
ncbi:hypothetical protein AB0B56_06235 [Streptosporangium canum]|uniref:hypothetical protein n=1 Tax=Streptosporangium canum TaxID=324952 RepID=UPI00341E1BA6